MTIATETRIMLSMLALSLVVVALAYTYRITVTDHRYDRPFTAAAATFDPAQ